MNRSAPPNKSNETLHLAVNAIKTLEELPGSTSRDIINYVKKNYAVEKDSIGKQVKASLKRGLAYGILRHEGGRYSLPIASDAAGEEIATQEIRLIEMCRRNRGRRKKLHEVSSKDETLAVSRKRSRGKNSPRGEVVPRRITKKRKSLNQDLRTADSCCCVRYESNCRRISRPRRFIGERDDRGNFDKSVAGYTRRKSTRRERRKNEDSRYNRLEND